MSNTDLHDQLIEEVTLARETVENVIDRVNSLVETVDDWNTEVSDAAERTEEVLDDAAED